MTVNAALWWDEADYLALAKHYGLGLPEIAAPWRARRSPMLLGIFYWLGANELIMRFVWVLLSVSGVLFTYIIGKRLYGKAVRLLSALFLSVYFEYLFWSARFSMDVFVAGGLYSYYVPFSGKDMSNKRAISIFISQQDYSGSVFLHTSQLLLFL